MLAAFKPRNAARVAAPALPAPAKVDNDTTFKASAFEGSAGAMMTVDRDLKILHVNEATRQLLRNNAAAFRTIWPSFNPDSIIGTCIDIFHKAPSHQRQILADPKVPPQIARQRRAAVPLHCNECHGQSDLEFGHAAGRQPGQ